MIQALFFDLHEVITHGDFSDIYVNVAGRLGISTETVTKYHKEHLGGLLTGEVTSAHMLAHFDLAEKMTVADLLQVWTEETVKCMSVDERMLALLNDLRPSYTLAALTNLTEQRYEADLAMDLYTYFDYKVLSFEHGVKKPDPDYFKRALAVVGCKPEEAVFIDDQEKNTAAAHGLGIPSITFTDYPQLVRELTKLGVAV